MPQEDRLKREIDLIGKLLAKLLSDLTGLKNDPAPENTIREVKKTLKEEAGLDINLLIESSPDEFKKILDAKNLTGNSLEQLADIFCQLAEWEQSEITANKFYTKALFVYEHLASSSSTYSLERYYKTEKLKKNLLFLD